MGSKIGSYIKLNDIKNTEALYKEWTSKKPQSRIAWYSWLSYKEQKKDFSGGLEVVKGLFRVYPDDTKGLVIKALFLAEQKNFTLAEEVLNSLPKEIDDNEEVKGLKGRIDFAKGNYLKATDNLLTLYNKKASPRNAGFVYTSMIKAKESKRAFEFMKDHLLNYPQDLTTRVFYAQLAIELDINLAREEYIELLKSRPSNIMFLGNLAWIESELGNNARAIEIAENGTCSKSKRTKRS